jgi:hypothetical protein
MCGLCGTHDEKYVQNLTRKTPRREEKSLGTLVEEYF